MLLYPFDLQRGQHEELQALLGVLPFRPPAEGEPACRSAVLIATRQLADEALLVRPAGEGTPPPGDSLCYLPPSDRPDSSAGALSGLQVASRRASRAVVSSRGSRGMSFVTH